MRRIAQLIVTPRLADVVARRHPRRWLWWSVLVVTVVAGGVVAVGGVWWGAGAFADTVDYRHATAGSVDRLPSEAGTVVGRDTWRDEERRYAEVTVRRADGRVQTLSYADDVYALVRPGEQARLYLWYDEVVGVGTDRGSGEVEPSTVTGMGVSWVVVWTGVGVALLGLLVVARGLKELFWWTMCWYGAGCCTVPLATVAVAVGPVWNGPAMYGLAAAVLVVGGTVALRIMPFDREQFAA